jgi:hypothetical protein
LLVEIGGGRILNTAYDTAWIARLCDLDSEMGEGALEWLREHQLPDGCWGTENPRYYHDRLICTIAAMTALARYGKPSDRVRWQRAQLALETIAKGLQADPTGATIGFEMIVPTLLSEAKSLGLIENNVNGALGQLERYRTAKLAALPGGMINRHVTVAFSAEMAGPDGLHLLDLGNLQEANGSLGHSPSATAYFASVVAPDDPAAMAYLRQIVTADGGAPEVAPFDVFEQAWTRWHYASRIWIFWKRRGCPEKGQGMRRDTRRRTATIPASCLTCWRSLAAHPIWTPCYTTNRTIITGVTSWKPTPRSARIFIFSVRCAKPGCHLIIRPCRKRLVF